MRAVAAFLFALVALPASAQVTFKTWQDVGRYAAQQTVKLNTHTDQVAALQAQVTDLTARLAAAEAQVAKSKQDVSNLIVSHNVNVYYFLVRACDYNRRVAGWAGVLVGLQPIPLAGLTCPPENTRFYVPYFHPDVSAVPIPPAP